MAYRLANRIFVGNVPWTVGKKEFREYFSQFGRIIRAEVVFDRETGLSRSYGFVHFGNEDAYNNVVKQKNHFLEGNFLEIDAQNSDRRGPRRTRPQSVNDNKSE